MAARTIIAYGISMAALTMLALIALPIMAEWAYGPTMNWDSLPEIARAQRDQVVAQYQWFILFIMGLVVISAIWNSSRKDTTVEESNEW